jgi:hypothetical protein
VISTLVSFAAVGIPHSAGQRPLTFLVISCFAVWRINRTEDLDVKACKEATDGVSASQAMMKATGWQPHSGLGRGESASARSVGVA